MTNTPGFEIRPLQAGAAADGGLMSELAELVNEVYADAERGLWADGAARTSAEEIAGFVAAGEIVVALVDGRIAGCVRVQELDAGTSEFGMLAAAPRHRGIGLGRELVRFAERRGRSRGHAEMQLELLVPRGWRHPSKEFLAGWYGRIGYRPVGTGAVEQDYPHLSPHLATPCDFVIYRKNLGPALKPADRS
ncbi:GNAT family N-acetyltransferase [Nonomuraea maheshkhaliensis]|uniref:GNAT family N-acetyltransferase n=1 Tax=Nonomuraea maheshkhaliensis TaxID=419590 RepID=A0ABP4T4A1_9ACTN